MDGNGFHIRRRGKKAVRIADRTVFIGGHIRSGEYGVWRVLQSGNRQAVIMASRRFVHYFQTHAGNAAPVLTEFLSPFDIGVDVKGLQILAEPDMLIFPEQVVFSIQK